MSKKYWIEITDCDGLYQWHIKCRNGRIKARSVIYSKFSLCFNDALGLADECQLAIRKGN